MNIILFGSPGAGKGTQSDKIAKSFNLHKISTGDLLRKEIMNNTFLGKKTATIIEKGLLVPDNVINRLIERILFDQNFFDGFIFDGYPRNLSQAKNLDKLLKKYNQKISCVLSLNVNKEAVIKRILGRLICSKCGLTFNKYFNPPQKKKYNCNLKYLKTRTDDNEKTIKNRFGTYLIETLPLLDYYTKQKLLHQIDGMREIDQIYDEICGIITSLET